MQLQDAILSVTQNPVSTRARAALAVSLQESSARHAYAVWAAAARLAAAKGDFFDALTLCRLHLPPAQQGLFLSEIINAYVAQPRVGEPPSPRPHPRRVQLPHNPREMVDFAARVGTDLGGVRLTNHLLLPEIPIFGDLPGNLLAVLTQNMAPVPLQRNQSLIQQGTRERSCYLVTHGRLRVTQRRPDGQENELARIEAPTVMGEISLLTSVSRRASVYAQTVGMAWRIDANLLSQMNNSHPSLIPQIRTLIRMRLISNLMRSNALFSELGEQQRYQFLQSFSMISVESKKDVVRQGQRAEGLFVLMHGQAVVLRQAGSRFEKIAELSEGDAFGAPSFFSGQPAEVTVQMPEGGLILQLAPRSYQAICKALPQIDRKLRALSYMRY